jgi:hypothetical protein
VLTFAPIAIQFGGLVRLDPRGKSLHSLVRGEQGFDGRLLGRYPATALIFVDDSEAGACFFIAGATGLDWAL